MKLSTFFVTLAFLILGSALAGNHTGSNTTDDALKKKQDNSQFGRPVYGKKHVKAEHVFHHEGTGAKSVLRYEVEHHDNVVHFRLQKYGVLDAKCSKGEMLLKFKTHDNMKGFAELLADKNTDKVLTGGCLDLKSLDVAGVAYKVLDFKARTDFKKSKSIILKVRDANFEEVFANAQAEAKFQPGFAESYKNHHQRHRRRLSPDQRRGLWGIGDEADCKDGEPDCNVDFGKEYTFNGFSKDWSGNLGGYGPVQVDCDSCFVKFTPSITFGLKVAFVKLKHVLLTVNGNLQATVRVSASASGSGSASNEKLIAHFDAPPVIFSIGAFPVKLKVSVPVNAGYSGEFNAQGKVSTGISGNVRTNAGVEYINGKFSRVGAFTPSFSAVTPTVGASASFDAEAYLEPKISMDINNVVRGYLNTRAAVQFEGSAQGSYTYGNSGSAQVDCTVSSTITANIGGELGLNVNGKNIGPRISLGEKQILDVSRKLWSGKKQVGGSSSFDTMDSGVFFDEDPQADNVFQVRDSSYLTMDVREEDRTDNGLGGV